MKKILLTATAIALLTANMIAQTQTKLKVGTNLAQTKSAIDKVSTATNPTPSTGQITDRRCGTQIPDKRWDEMFNKMVEDYKRTMPAGKTTSTTYTIPVIFHIIYSNGESVGSGHNVSQAQVNSQIPILNADYAGTGYNTSLYAAMTMGGHPAFYDYALSAGLPAPDNNGVVIAGSGITFCLATKNPSGTTLAEPGIDRHTWQSISGATDPASSGSIQTLFDGTIKPATIWDVTKYFNVWVSDGGTSGLLGYATFPPGTGLSGLSGTGTTTTDGVWMAYNALGNTGAAAAPYNLGRTLTHESGHWLGLRHIWGDGNCLTDYCNDTPPATAANFVNCGTAYPFHANSCTGTPPNGNGPDGEMYMNFMDYSNDCGMWMFTTDQVTRFHTTMANSPYRSGLTSSAVTECNVAVVTPVAAFSYPGSICAAQAAVFTDASTGPPTSWSWSVTPSAGVTITTATSQNPSINFLSAGNYTVSLTATNSQGSGSTSHVVTVTSCTSAVCDTVTHIGNTDTLSLYTTATSTACANKGYFMGTNCYNFTGLSEAYLQTNFPTGMQIKGAIVLFYTKTAAIGTHGVSTHTVTTVSMVNGNTNPGAAAVATKAITYANLSTVTPVKSVHYAGTPGLGYTNPIISPYVAMFPAPVTLTSDFFMSLTMPVAGDTIALFSGAQGHNTTNTAWVDYTGTWSQFSALGTKNFSLGIIPIACPTGSTGIEHNALGNNINLFPNPSNGHFNFAIAMPEAANLNFSVVNTLGQVVFTRTENNVMNTVLTYDLSSLGKGVYFVNITDNQNNKTVKKIIIE